METIGLIAAMHQESGALLRLIKGWNRIQLGSYRGFSFRAKERNCFLITSGMGIKRARDATRVLFAEASPELIISFGIAGAVNPNLQIGDVVVSSNICLLDKEGPCQFRPLSLLSEAAMEAVTLDLQPDQAHLFIGTAITTHGAQVTIQEKNEMPHPILEMETAGIAQVSNEKGIPLVSIRSISDSPQAPIPIDLETAMDENDNLRIGRLLSMVLRHPRIIFQSGRMMKNSRIASEHAARALIAALNQPASILRE